MHVVRVGKKASVGSADISRWFWEEDKLHRLLRIRKQSIWGQMVTRQRNKALLCELEKFDIVQASHQDATLYAIEE